VRLVRERTTVGDCCGSRTTVKNSSNDTIFTAETTDGLSIIQTSESISYSHVQKKISLEDFHINLGHAFQTLLLNGIKRNAFAVYFSSVFVEENSIRVSSFPRKRERPTIKNRFVQLDFYTLP
jgi:hypothetical protein